MTRDSWQPISGTHHFSFSDDIWEHLPAFNSHKYILKDFCSLHDVWILHLFPSLYVRKKVVVEETHPTIFSSHVIPTAVCFGLHTAITAFK